MHSLSLSLSLSSSNAHTHANTHKESERKREREQNVKQNNKVSSFNYGNLFCTLEREREEIAISVTMKIKNNAQ